MEIYVDEDERTCPQCAELEGKKYKITEKMPVPVHPSCRCTILPVVPEGIECKETEDNNMDKIKLDESVLKEWNDYIEEENEKFKLDFRDRYGKKHPEEIKRDIYQSMMSEEDAEKYDTLRRQTKDRRKRFISLYDNAGDEEKQWNRVWSAEKLYKKTVAELEEMEKGISKLATCPMCHKLFMRGSNAQTYCPECQKEYRKWYKAQKEKERRAKNKNK